MSEGPSSEVETFTLGRGRATVVLHATGFRHPGGFFAVGERFVHQPGIEVDGRLERNTVGASQARVPVGALHELGGETGGQGRGLM